ncbi:bifunctional folylpolyglutamate synthase/dihydrofolate synthase [Gimesia algae]|uniref:Dihydrofolate synthase/folylpolyglutamate synthase n=1 Tax=Gimesia algae TaxID=2527971 RepID=A0A517V826_9PLAN|nr:folylpolyglutamate synthase/dihydrofolate synthase family protein [Gimesia algae]QDT89132.1 Folylpolyglutamate synthase [Gimesia algae]
MGVSAEKYQQSLDFLFGRLNYERMGSSKYSTSDFKLGRMQELLDSLGNPQLQVPTIHIAGTKGKGSTSVMIAEMLSAAGFRTGLFTSPHITCYEERILIDGQQIEREQLVELVSELIQVVEQLDLKPGNLSPTFFELTTALAWMHFQTQHVDFAVMEVGLGGRLDSTNVCAPLASVVTNISYDHTALLGNTIEQITREKAGIIKQGVPVFSGVTQPEALAVLEEVCQDKQAPLYLLNRDFNRLVEPHQSVKLEQTDDSSLLPDKKQQNIQVRTPWSLIDQMPVTLLGTHQLVNATLAVTVIDYLRQQGIPLEDGQMRQGMSCLKWPARIELVQKTPPVIIDTAHNGASIEALVETLAASFPQSNRILIFAATKDKDVGQMLGILLSHFQTVVLTQYLSNPRRIPVEELVDLTRETQKLTGNTSQLIFTDSPEAAWSRAKEVLTSDSLVCVTGSFFIAAELRELLLGTTDEVLVAESC